MEQYVHLLIPSNPKFVPSFDRLAGFFEMLVGSWKYEIDWESKYTPGLGIVWATAAPRAEVDERSGRQLMMMPRFEKVPVKRIAEIAAAFEQNGSALEGRSGCVVVAQGKWQELPVKIPRSLWPADEWEYACSVGCRLHPEPVCTADWWGEDGDDPSQSRFGKPVEADGSTGRFTRPLSRKTVVVPHGGSARFWIELNFAEWLMPHLPDDFDLLDPLLVGAAEDHFGVKLAQAGRGVG